MHASGKRQGVKHQSRVRKLSLHVPYAPGVARDLRRAACGMRGDFSGSAGKLQAAPLKKRHLITLRGLIHVGRRNDDRHLPGAAFGFENLKKFLFG